MMKKQTKTQNKKKRIALELQKSVISGITAIFWQCALQLL